VSVTAAAFAPAAPATVVADLKRSAMRMQIRTYLFPASLTLLVFSSFFLLSFIPQCQFAKKRVSKGIECVSIPCHFGTELLVLVDKDGVYIGDDFIAIPLLVQTLEQRYVELKVSRAIIYSTDSARYGDVLTVVFDVKEALHVTVDMASIGVGHGDHLAPTRKYDQPFYDY